MKYFVIIVIIIIIIINVYILKVYFIGSFSILYLIKNIDK